MRCQETRPKFEPANVMQTENTQKSRNFNVIWLKEALNWSAFRSHSLAPTHAQLSQFPEKHEFDFNLVRRTISCEHLFLLHRMRVDIWTKITSEPDYDVQMFEKLI